VQNHLFLQNSKNIFSEKGLAVTITETPIILFHEWQVELKISKC